tara:strand:- start:913 stop:1077 length:165 start_codon:yes stop_codon:yes gene_type:complete
MIDKKYTSVVSIKFGGNNFTAENKEDYIKKVKESFYQEFGLEIEDFEITEITRD